MRATLPAARAPPSPAAEEPPTADGSRLADSQADEDAASRAAKGQRVVGRGRGVPLKDKFDLNDGNTQLQSYNGRKKESLRKRGTTRRKREGERLRGSGKREERTRSWQSGRRRGQERTSKGVSARSAGRARLLRQESANLQKKGARTTTSSLTASLSCGRRSRLQNKALLVALSGVASAFSMSQLGTSMGSESLAGLRGGGT